MGKIVDCNRFAWPLSAATNQIRANEGMIFRYECFWQSVLCGRLFGRDRDAPMLTVFPALPHLNPARL